MKLRLLHKLLFGFGLIIFLALVIGGVGYERIQSIQNSLYVINEETNPMVEMVHELIQLMKEMESLSMEVLLSTTTNDVDGIQAAVDEKSQLYDEKFSDLTAIVPDDALLADLQYVDRNSQNFLQAFNQMVSAKKNSINDEEDLIILLAKYEENLNSLDMYFKRNQSQMEIWALIMEWKGVVYQAVSETDTKSLEELQNQIEVIQQELVFVSDKNPDEALSTLIEQQYEIAQGDNGLFVVLENKIHNDVYVIDKTETMDEYVALLTTGFNTSIQDIQDMNHAALQQTEKQVRNAKTLILFIGLSIIVIGVIVSLFISGQIANAVKKMVNLADSISQNDLVEISKVMDALSMGDYTLDIHINADEIDYESSDEIGDLATALNFMVKRLNDMGRTSQRMIEKVRNTFFAINKDIMQLYSSSKELNGVSLQSSEATNQIATTIQQIARSTTEQTEGVSVMADTVEELSKMIEGVSKGAESQTQAINQTIETIQQMQFSIDGLIEMSKIVNNTATDASSLSNIGANQVNETIAEMEVIREKVEISSSQVQEMGKISARIGTMVEAIEDIASQTHLLALNATIEAARAGEHGKGFAVVAEEVGKLAARSADSTQQIVALVKDIQNTVSNAIEAMNISSQEVNQGVGKARETGDALNKIKEAIDSVNEQAENAEKLASNLVQASSELDNQTSVISSVVNDNLNSTKDMRQHSTNVLDIVENLASISEENSAAVEEVSASTEEMSAQVQEVAQSASVLSAMSDSLAVMLSDFYLGNDDMTIAVLPIFVQSHRRWVDLAHDIVNNQQQVTQAIEEKANTDCHLKKWIRGSGRNIIWCYDHAEDLIMIHDSFHGHFLDLIALTKQDQWGKTVEVIEALERDSEMVIQYLEEIYDLYQEGKRCEVLN